MISYRRFLLFAAFSGPAVVMGQPVLSLSSASGLISSPVATSLSISGGTASNSPSVLQFALAFQAADFSSVVVAPGPAAVAAGKSISCNTVTGRVRCVAWGMNKNRVSNGVIATVTVIPSPSSLLASRPISISEVTSAATEGALTPVNAPSGGVIQVAAAAASTLSSLTCNPSSIAAGGAATCTVALSGVVAAATAVAISDNSAALTVPASVTIAAGKSSATFTAQAAASAGPSAAVITAALNGASRTTSLSIGAALISVKCYPNPIGPGATATCTLVLSGAVAASTVVAISDDSSALTVPASVTIAPGQASATFAARAGSFTATSTALITATLNGVSKTSYLTLIANGCPCSIFDTTSAPKTQPVLDTVAVELGIKFRSKAAGTITGIRFYKHGTNTGAHVGSLWTQRGELIGRVNFTNETASGWQTASFAKPIPIAANTTYVASYRSPTGRFSADRDYFTNSRAENSNLYALRNGEEGVNGVFRYGNSAFPSTGDRSTNYWVDVVFSRNTGAPGSSASALQEVSSLSVSGADAAANPPAGDTMAAAAPSELQASSLHVPQSELARPGNPVSFVVGAEDSQGNPATVTPLRLPAGATFDALSNRLQWTPSADQVGDQVLAFQAITAAGENTKQESKFKVGWGLPEIDQSSSPACSPLSIGKLQGNWLTEEELSDPSGSSLELGQTRVRINGLLAPVLHTHPQEIEFQCPADAPGSSLSISVETPSGTTSTTQTTVLPASPVILTSQRTSDGLLLVRATGIAAAEVASGEVKLNGVAAPIEEAAPSPDAIGVTDIYVKVPESVSSDQAVPVQLEIRSLNGETSVSKSTVGVVK